MKAGAALLLLAATTLTLGESDGQAKVRGSPGPPVTVYLLLGYGQWKVVGFAGPVR